MNPSRHLHSFTAPPKKDRKLAPSAVEISNGSTLNVLEIYPAVQGEGQLTGMPSLFVRLAGCTVGCDFCDTKYSWKAAAGFHKSPKELADEIAEYGISHIVLTGGEPLEHPSVLLEELFELLNTRPQIQHITIETSGVIEPFSWFSDVWDFEILFSVAPKLSHANANYEPPALQRFIDFQYDNADISLQLKFVVRGIALVDDVREVQRYLLREIEEPVMFHVVWESVQIFLQPCTIFSLDEDHVRNQIVHDTRTLQEALIELDLRNYPGLPNTLHLMVRPQFHAILYGSKRGI